MNQSPLAPLSLELPDQLQALSDLATNLWWSWAAGGSEVFAAIDPLTWKRHHNPLRLLREVDPRRLEELAATPTYVEQVEQVARALRSYLNDEQTWFQTHYPGRGEDLIAYLSAEFGLHESLPIYCGGLGILAGDHMKAASDLGVPLIGVGLLYRHGYFDQQIRGDGTQHEIYPQHDFEMMPLRRVLDDDGEALAIDIPVSDRLVRAEAWVAEVGRNRVYLLNTDFEGARERDRKICGQLYGTKRPNRLEQEQILGLGAIHLTHRLRLRPVVWHMNEGHSAFQILARLRRRIVMDKDSYEEALRVVAARSVFTTHTPVAAGNEAFDVELVQQQLGSYCRTAGIDPERFIDLGRQSKETEPAAADQAEAEAGAAAAEPQQGEATAAETQAVPEPGTDAQAADGADAGAAIDDEDEEEPENPSGEELSLTVLALRLSALANGVSRLHARVSREMWAHVFPEEEVDDVPIAAVTNGVHTRTWMAPAMVALLDEHFGGEWEQRLTDPDWWKAARDLPGEEIWTIHQTLKKELIEFVRDREDQRLGREGKGSAPRLLPDALTIGFARRFAPYKRANLIFSDPERLKRILTNEERPVQIIFAGKAYPTDESGKEIVAEVGRMANDPELAGRVVLLENYDIDVGRHLVQGVDVWLNNPRRPLEASGTSGQKVPLNGGINLSILDGWWPEAYDGENGWAISDDRERADEAVQDAADALSLFELLENEVVPLYWDREDGLPKRWIQRMVASLATVIGEFSAARMVAEYTSDYYMPTAEKGRLTE